MKNKKLKLLFLVKKNNNYGVYVGNLKSGLLNSARFVVDAINNIDCIEAEIDFCVDGNDIDNKLVKYKPDICIIEAIWVTPKKFIELNKLHPHIKFIVRIHSKTPFLSMEGTALNWIREYRFNDNIILSFNNVETSHHFNKIGISNVFLPNIYKELNEVKKNNVFSKVKYYFNRQKFNIDKSTYKIGCFGAIRPFKNHLNQAMAAILFADSRGANLEFYVNGSRTEQNGQNVLKNIRALFKDSKHKLIEIDWHSHEDFLKLIATMDMSLQVSYTESFNIVSADCVYMEVPIVVSSEINWITTNIANPNDIEDIANKIESGIIYKKANIQKNLESLYQYNQKAIRIWKEYLEEIN